MSHVGRARARCPFVIVLIVLCLLAVPLSADFQAGLRAYEAKDYAAALKEWQPLAEKGDAHAQYNLGLMYAKGEGVQQSHSEAARWYQKAAEQGVPAAQYNLGVMYGNGQGVPKDLEKAAEWYQKAAGSGVAGAANNLGTIFNEGEGAFQNHAEAEKWYRAAAEKGIATAQFNLGVMYDIGEGVEKDYAEAVKWYRQAAEQGLPSAMRNLAVLYYNGQGVERDLVQAYAWFARAAAAGDERSRALEASTRTKLKPKELAQVRDVLLSWRAKPVQVDYAALAQRPEEFPAETTTAAAVPAQGVAARSTHALSGAADAKEPQAVPVATNPPAGAPAAPGEPSATAAPPAAEPVGEPEAAPPAGSRSSLSGAAANGTNTWTGIERVVAIGDVHGDYEQFFGALSMAGLIDSGGNWTGGKSHLVQTGDILDRGPDSRKVMDLLMHLEHQAKAAGGYVHVLIGNHEAMNLYGDYRYVSPGEIAAFRAEFDPDDQGSAERKDLRAAATPQAPPAQTGQVSGKAEHHAAMGPAGRYGKWLAGKNAAIKINDTLFLHAGISPKYTSMPLSEINRQVREELQNPGKLHGGIVLDEQGPLWYRGLASGNQDELRPHVESVLRNFGVQRIVIGHSYANAAITPRFDGKVVLIDIGLPRVYDNIGKMGVFLLEGGKAYALHRGKRLELPSKDGEPMLQYLKQAASADPSPSPLSARIKELEDRLQ
jgi:TPR repeat protein